MIPTDLRVADHLVDETGVREVIGKPFSTGTGRVVHVRVRKVDHPDWTDLRTWGAHERLTVKTSRQPSELNRRANLAPPISGDAEMLAS
jgi:hypothetical protein